MFGCLDAHKSRKNIKGGGFEHGTKWLKVSNIFKPLLFAHGLCVTIQLDASAPSFGHGVGKVRVTLNSRPVRLFHL